ncbi:heavy metal-associated domain-containing protein [Streptomyces sp. NBC_00316]|uniref:heavy metal-associated domain-containing protein n=1 Tax=Streptomyces sp. NBC_00316 TaxID=2975710 RepID=UPI002E281FF2|nr:heavy metal-associated domain-containing protein [Streptomyces sp. NBC_00316]
MHSATEAEAPAAAPSRAELTIDGMTCASCAARVEKKLNRMDGVTATVNYATEKARVEFGAGTRLADLIATVERTGYTAQSVPWPAPAPSAAPGQTAGPAPEPAADTAGSLADIGPGAEPGTDFETPDTAKADAARTLAALRQRLVVSAVLAAPVVLLSK